MTRLEIGTRLNGNMTQRGDMCHSRDATRDRDMTLNGDVTHSYDATRDRDTTQWKHDSTCRHVSFS